MTPQSASVVVDGDNLLFIDRKNREYLRRVRTGRPVKLRDGTIPADDLIGQPEGRYVRNTRGDSFLVLRPTYAQLIPNLPRQAQPIYPKDTASILLWGDIYPGARVIEVGTGPGALSMALLRAIGPTGALYSYELREDFATLARGNVERFHGTGDNWTIKVRDAREGFDESEVDRITIDMPEPWDLLPGIAAALRPGGVLVIYVPGTTQIKQAGDALAEDRRFGHTQTFETLLRTWHVAGRSVRPDHRMVAHTGFLMVSRRVLPAELPPEEPAEQLALPPSVG
jgi:tRNA (adenine57-N1/adenine58-N1)-methyltransferase